ncbi:MAG: rRNA pseudouridine synthase [Bacteroidales bacterium]|nr:rRNA pseudouridine synthase [Bacteroidales bacterium]
MTVDYENNYSREDDSRDDRREGGFQDRRREGGFHFRRREGGFQDRRRDGHNRSERREGGRRDFRRDSDREGYRPYRRDSFSEGERRPFRGDREERRPYRDGDEERRPYRSDNEERRPYRGGGEGRREGFRRERRGFSDRTSYRKSPKYIEDSPIIDEIVKKRKEEGRNVEHKPKVLSLEWNEEHGLIRLNKYIANAGVCSRRDADLLIESGQVTVNGEVVTELGTKIQPTDVVCYGDHVLQREKPVYILLNKPKDYITTTSDEYDRKNVMNLVAGACPQRVYPVGRLDRNTTGLLLITNDGELAKKLTHPRYGVKKIYQVELDKSLSQEDFQQIISGLELKDGFIAPDELAYVGESRREIGITLHSGKNRIVRRIFEHLGYEVVKLDRVYYAGLTKKDLPRGEWRFLRKEEVNILKMSL